VSSLPSFVDKPTIIGNRVRLRPLTVADTDVVMETLADVEAMRLTGTHREFTEAAVRATLARWSNQDDRIDWAVVEHATGEHAGEVVLNDLDPHNASCGFRIALTGRYTGRGLGTEATRLAVGHAFDTVGLHRVELEVYSFNPRAHDVYVKAGFVHEGTRRHALCWDGEWIDAHVMAILAHEWANRADRTPAPR